MNERLLTKLAWKIISHPQSLISRVLGAKYDKGKGWSASLGLVISSKLNISGAWRGVELGLKRVHGKTN